MIKPQCTTHNALTGRIAEGFSKAAASYNQYAGIQQEIAEYALSVIPQRTYTQALDIGCGTGRHTRSLSTYSNKVIGIDVAKGMVEQARKNHPSIFFVQACAERIPLPSAGCDLVFSSMALQWCDSPELVMQEIACILAAGGRASLAIMVAGSFGELANARRRAGHPPATNPLVSSHIWQDAAVRAGFHGIRSETRTYTAYFDHVMPLLKSIKHVGAGTLVNPELSGGFSFNRREINRLQLAYQGECTVNGRLPLSYNVCHLVLEKS